MKVVNDPGEVGKRRVSEVYFTVPTAVDRNATKNAKVLHGMGKTERERERKKNTGRSRSEKKSPCARCARGKRVYADVAERVGTRVIVS